MKIVNITKKNYLCELSLDELKLITLNKIWSDDLEKIFRNKQNIDLAKFNNLSSIEDINSVTRSIKELKSAISFLENKKESLEYINHIKVD